MLAFISRGVVFNLLNRCIINKPAPRWANVPIPSASSLIFFIGMCSYVSMSGQLALDIDNIVFCPTSNAPSSHDATLESDDSGPSPKRRKYPSYAPPRVPISSPSKTRTTSAPSDNVASSSASANTGAQHLRYRVFFSIFYFIYHVHSVLLSMSLNCNLPLVILKTKMRQH